MTTHMSINAYPNFPVNELSRIFKLLSEPNRLRILCSMGLDCTPVSAIIAKTGLSQTNVSFHLRAMREAGVVKGERRGSFVFYCLYDYRLLDILSELEEWRSSSNTERQKQIV